jgi:hypothetical protein
MGRRSRIGEVVAGSREPWRVLSDATHRPQDEVLDPACGVLGAATYERKRRLLYIAEQGAGPWDETAVHVWKVK